MVARPTSWRLRARSEKTEAPSTPMNTQTVTSIMALTWVSVEPRSLWVPQKSAEKVPILKAVAPMMMKTIRGTILAMVTTTLTTAASRMPRRMSRWYSHRSAEETTVARSVVPSPNPGRNTPIAVIRRTRYPTLPIQALNQ